MKQAAGMRSHRDYLAFAVHRVSGLVLVLFLPVHLYVLGLALSAPQSLDGFLVWTRQPLVKISEALLIFLLAVHLAGGMRLLFVEFIGLGKKQGLLVAVTFCTGLAAALMYLLQVW